MRIWLAGEDNLGDVARLLGEFRNWFGNSTPTDEEMLESAKRIFAEDGEFLLGALDDGPVGVCQLRFRWSVWTSSHDAWIEDVFVREEARGSGLGRALVETAIARARERGCARIELDVDEANTPALSLYRSLGFAEDMKAEARSLLMGLRLRRPG